VNRYRLLRYERGLTRSEVAGGSGVPERTIRDLEHPERERPPSAPIAKALADFYGMSVAELLGVDPAPEAA